MAYQTVAATLERREVIKNSEFIAFVCPVATLDEVEAQLLALRKKYPDANHHCFAYKIGPLLRFSDDGEPGGTAGRPMLEVITKRKLDHVLAVVVRYFGGTKLGAGGLVRAYSGSLSKALDEAGMAEHKDRIRLVFEVSFSKADPVLRFLGTFQELTKEASDYTVNGLKLCAALLAADEEVFRQAIIDVTRGQVIWLERFVLP
jgi:uncharacterized YigZ family protein